MLRNFGISLFLVAHVVAAQDVWNFSSILGGVGFDSAVDVGGDLDGNTYIAGISSSEGEPFTRAAPNVGRRRGYLMKLDTGGQLVYLRFFNGDVTKLFVLPNRDVLVAGSSAAVDSNSCWVHWACWIESNFRSHSARTRCIKWQLNNCDWKKKLLKHYFLKNL